MFRVIFCFISIFVLTLSVKAFELNHDSSVAQFWAQAERLSGAQGDMGLRSLMFHKIYLDSGKKLPFALSVSHLTLAIERSLEFGSVDEMHGLVPYSQTIKQDAAIWREALQKMNQDMFRKTFFAYQLGKFRAFYGRFPADYTESDEKIQAVTSILPVMIEIHEARAFSDFTPEDIDRQFHVLVTWEHAELFQPQLEDTYERLHWLMKANLRNIPGPFLEANILEPFFNMRSTLSLECFVDPTKKLKTADFLNSEQRIDQAKQFFKELQKIKYDPAQFCYNDEYYLTQFESEFFVDPEFYLNKLAVQVLYGATPDLSSPHKQQALARSFSTKLSPQRVFTKLFHQCEVQDLNFWKTYILNLLDFPKSLLMSNQYKSRGAIAKLEMGVAKNALINRAYVELFSIHANREESKHTPIIPFSWLGSAVFGSNSVGQELLYGMLYIFKGIFPDQVIEQFAADDIATVKTYMDGYSAAYSVVPGFIKTLASANQAVFNDIYWQFLVAELCGIPRVISLLEQSEELTDQKSLLAWRKLLDGNFKDANLELLRVEQEFVLQPLLYSGVAAKYFSYRKVFNRYAKPGAPGPNGALMTFDEYSFQMGFENNLALLDSRMTWVNYLVENHAVYFSQENQNGRLDEAFSEITRVYDKVLRYYETSTD